MARLLYGVGCYFDSCVPSGSINLCGLLGFLLMVLVQLIDAEH